MTWSFRITVRGRFSDLDEHQCEDLRTHQAEHDMFAARFTPEGTFLYTHELVNYQHRFFITADEVNPDDAELEARVRAEELAGADLVGRGLWGRTVDVSAVCIENLKIRPGRRR